MKKIKLLLLLLMLTGASAYSQLQQIKIVSFTVKNQLPAVIDNWSSIPGSLLLVAQLPPTVQVKGIRLMIQIKAGGALVCGNNSTGGMQVDDFTTRSFSASELTGALQGCHDLKEGSYAICVQFFNVDRVAISNEVCKEFSVEIPKETDYTPPSLIAPNDGKQYTEADVALPVSFRWTPVVPRPRDPVTYRLRVWQLMQGQSASSAMKTNQPIATKDVDNITQAVVTGVLPPGPCRPPFLCEFVWNVQALGKDGKPLAKNEGNSAPFNFTKKIEDATQFSPPTLLSPDEDKAFTEIEAQKPLIFRWTPVVPRPNGKVTYKLRVWQLMQGQNSTSAMRTNQPIATKEVDNITQAVVTNIWTGPCHPPYLCEFVWAVQAVIGNATAPGAAELNSEIRVFSVKESNQKASLKNSFPEDKNSFTATEAGKPITFRWTPLVPKPKEPVTYRMKVWQLMQGQSSSQAMKTNNPIVTKEVMDITEATVSDIYTGPCRPPYLCEFVWSVEASTSSSTGASQVIATSEPTSFDVKEGNAATIKNTSPEDKKGFTADEAGKPITFRWTPVVPKPQSAVTYRMKVWQLMQGQSSSQAMKTNNPIVTREVMDITEATVSDIYTGPCRPPYLCDYVWGVEATTRNATGATQVISTSAPTEFNVKEPVRNECEPPKLSEPADGKAFAPKDASVGISFRWTPVVTRSQEPVTYRLKVWQLMQGQSGTTAMRENKPIVEKEMMLTEATISNIYTGPCRPPYLCDYIWEVQALNREGKPICSNEGKSEAWSFKIQNNIDIQIDSLKVGCCEKGKQSIYIKVRNNLATTVKVVAVKYKINGAGAAISLSPISPVLPQTIVGNGFVVFTGSIECNPAINFLKFLVDAEDVADPDNKETEVKSDTLDCICTACKDIKIQPNEKDKPTVTATAITQNLSFVTGSGKVKSVKMDLVWFEFVPESDDCLVCTTPSAQMGNFSSGTLNGVGGSGGGTHGLTWNFSPPKDMNGGVALQYNISYPKMVACCGGKARWCIRYTVTYENCITCSTVICNYEAAIKGCNK